MPLKERLEFLRRKIELTPVSAGTGQTKLRVWSSWTFFRQKPYRFRSRLDLLIEMA